MISDSTDVAIDSRGIVGIERLDNIGFVVCFCLGCPRYQRGLRLLNLELAIRIWMNFILPFHFTKAVVMVSDFRVEPFRFIDWFQFYLWNKQRNY